MDEQLRRLIDERAIHDCLNRYCRAIDRADADSLAGLYWPDATDDHGPFSGTAAEFVAYARARFEAQPRNIHLLTNVIIDFDGMTRAHVESCFVGLQRRAVDTATAQRTLMVGRFLDLFERRGDEWRIKRRQLVFDWLEQSAIANVVETALFGEGFTPIGAPYPHDPVYTSRN